MFKYTVLAFALAIPSLSLVACDHHNKHHAAAVTTEQKQRQADKNVEEMKLLNEELMKDGFTLNPPSDKLNFAVEAVAAVATEVSGNDKLVQVQKKLQHYIEIGNETLNYAKSKGVNVENIDDIANSVKIAKAYNDEINKEANQDKAEENKRAEEEKKSEAVTGAKIDAETARKNAIEHRNQAVEAKKAAEEAMRAAQEANKTAQEARLTAQKENQIVQRNLAKSEAERAKRNADELKKASEQNK